VDTGGLRGQVMVNLFPVFIPRHQSRKLAAQQLGKLRAGLVDGFLRRFVFASGYRLSPRLQPGGLGVADDAIDITGLYKRAEGRQPVKLIALGGELGGAGFDDFRDFVWRLLIDEPYPLFNAKHSRHCEEPKATWQSQSWDCPLNRDCFASACGGWSRNDCVSLDINA